MQQKAGRWHEHKSSIDLQCRTREFLKGAQKYRKSLKVTLDDIVTNLKRGWHKDDERVYYIKETSWPKATSAAEDTERQEMKSLLEFLQEGGVSYLPERRKNGWVCIMFEIWNSLEIFAHSWKIDMLNYLAHHLNIDIITRCEIRCDWRFVESGQSFLD
jgi:hypothetical protein